MLNVMRGVLPQNSFTPKSPPYPPDLTKTLYVYTTTILCLHHNDNHMYERAVTLVSDLCSFFLAQLKSVSVIKKVECFTNHFSVVLYQSPRHRRRQYHQCHRCHCGQVLTFVTFGGKTGYIPALGRKLWLVVKWEGET